MSCFCSGPRLSFVKFSIFLFIAGVLFVNSSAAQTCYANAGRDTAICPGTCVTIGGAIPAQDTSRLCSSVIYRWSPVTGLNDPNIGNPTACPSARTTYTLKVYFFGLTNNDTCCVASSSVTVDIRSTCSNSKENNLPKETEFVLKAQESSPNGPIDSPMVFFEEKNVIRLTQDKK